MPWHPLLQSYFWVGCASLLFYRLYAVCRLDCRINVGRLCSKSFSSLLKDSLHTGDCGFFLVLITSSKWDMCFSLAFAFNGFKFSNFQFCWKSKKILHKRPTCFNVSLFGGDGNCAEACLKHLLSHLHHIIACRPLSDLRVKTSSPQAVKGKLRIELWFLTKSY